MPYTPPSARSPATSTPTSPEASRRPSLQSTASRPLLPRSASYLTRHRRTPSAFEPGSNAAINQPTPEATSEDLRGMVSNSVRQSPPPVTEARGMPKGAIISPPDSNSNSDEDETPDERGRQIENLKELHDALSQIPLHRESSPSKDLGDAGDLLVLPSQVSAIAEGMQQSLGGSLPERHHGHRISHTRSTTEPNIHISKSADNSLTASDDEDIEPPKKPQMVRKKSGELVRPALRPPSRRRPSSMPGTPTFSKAVHFDSHLEHVRHFLQVDRPAAVSAGSSPADNYESDGEFPFPGEQRRTPPFEWEIVVTNFPLETPARKVQPVRLERVWLSNDQKSLTGSVAVANLAFHKTVTCRFTLDYWKTTSEVAADYVAEIRPRETPEGHDRFQFNIKLSDMANLETKTLYFCIRYAVNGHEHWDNNGGTNFQVDFKKKMLPQNGKRGMQGAASRPVSNGLPKSNRRSNPSSAPRPKSMPLGFDDFGDGAKVNFDQSLQDYLGESNPPLRLKGVKSATNLPSDNLTSRLSSPSGQAFANRYDFGASLTAAVQAAKDSMGSDGLYMKRNHRKSGVPAPAADASKAQKPAATNTATVATNKALPPLLTQRATDSPNSGSMSSASYEELVNKYCFFGSKQSSPQIKDGTLRNGQVDGSADEYVTRGTNSTESSSNGSPLYLGSLRQIHGAQHHGMHPPRDNNPYFPAVHMSGSPASSTSTLKPERVASPSQPRSMTPVSSASPGRSGSPASMMETGGFPPLAGTLSPEDLSFQMHDRFPFTGPETHTATAIRG